MQPEMEKQTNQPMGRPGSRVDGRAAPAKETGKDARRRRFALWALVFLLCLLFYPRAKALILPDRVRLPDGKTVTKRTNDINVLLMGIDGRKGDNGRSDAMMLLNYNALYNSLHLMSIPRDTRVKIPEHGYQKINAAYVFGGPSLAKQTAGELTGLCVDYFLEVDFDGFAEVIDALGGVSIDVKTRMSYDDPYQDLHIHFEPGRQHLDGGRALEYVRWRGDSRSDLGRVERQREFLNAAFRRGLSPAGLLRLPLILHALGKCVKTDMPALARPGVAANVALAYICGLKTSTVPGSTATIGDGSYFLADQKKLQDLISSWGRAPFEIRAASRAK